MVPLELAPLDISLFLLSILAISAGQGLLSKPPLRGASCWPTDGHCSAYFNVHYVFSTTQILYQLGEYLGDLSNERFFAPPLSICWQRFADTVYR
jgi:hypothetical protein